MTTTDILTDKLNPKFKQLFAGAIRRTTALHPTPVIAEGKAAILAACADNPTGSRIGGAALITNDHPWPVDSDGFPMQHLAQLNLAELPPREGYPTSGLLQFFIKSDLDLGWTDDTATVHVVRFLPETELSQGQLEFYAPEEDNLMYGGFFTITGQLYDQTPSIEDRDFDVNLSEEDEEAYWDLMNRIHFTTFGGGWAYFTQGDPRKDDDHQLLLQIDSYFDSQREVTLMWGDAGIGNFFITPQDLANLDFSNVLYNWDCH